MSETNETKEPTEIHPEGYYVAGTCYTSTLVEDLKIDKANLSESYETHSDRYAFYATAYEMAVDHENRMKVKLERAYAILDGKARGLLAAQGEKVTEKKVENVVITTDDYKQIQDELLDAKLQVGLLKSARDAMIHRKDMLISLGANYRAEVNSDPSLRTQSLQESVRGIVGQS